MKMKKISFVIILMFVCLFVFGEIMSIPFTPEEFEVEIIQYPHMIAADNPESEQLDTRYTFTNKDETYQVRYTFFKQTNNEPDYTKMKIPYRLLIMPVIFNIAGHDNYNVSDFRDLDVLFEFNGSFGSTVFIRDPDSDFGRGYAYLMINFYYKVNQGIVAQSILFNDLSFAASQEFIDVFHSFKFLEWPDEIL